MRLICSCSTQRVWAMAARVKVQLAVAQRGEYPQTFFLSGGITPADGENLNAFQNEPVAKDLCHRH